MRLAGKSIVITGARGIAASGARRASAEGAQVFIVSLDEEQCAALADEVGAAGYAAADLRDETAAEGAFARATSSLGEIDGLFAVAGGSGRSVGDGPAHEIPLEGWEKTFQMNLSPMFLAARETVRRMGDDGGSIVIVSSVLATRPVPGMFSTHAYAAAKGAALSFTTSLAAEYAERNIRVNALAPGLVRTPMSERAANDPAIAAYAARKQPLAGGMMSPEAVAGAAVFLLSDEAAEITGQVLAVDGGWSVTEA